MAEEVTGLTSSHIHNEELNTLNTPNYDNDLKTGRTQNFYTNEK